MPQHSGVDNHARNRKPRHQTKAEDQAFVDDFARQAPIDDSFYREQATAHCIAEIGFFWVGHMLEDATARQMIRLLVPDAGAADFARFYAMGVQRRREWGLIPMAALPVIPLAPSDDDTITLREMEDEA